MDLIDVDVDTKLAFLILCNVRDDDMPTGFLKEEQFGKDSVSTLCLIIEISRFIRLEYGVTLASSASLRCPPAQLFVLK